MHRLFTIIFGFIATTVSVSAQFNWESYLPSTMDSLRIVHEEILHIDSTAKGTDVRITKGTHKYRILVRNADSVQAMRSEVKQACDFWLTNLIRRADLKESYLHEISVESGGKQYWIPIQEPLIPALRNEIPRGSTFYIYVILIGSIWDELILSINEFEAI